MNMNIPKKVKVTDNGIIFYSNLTPSCGIYCHVSGKDVKIERIYYDTHSTHNLRKKVTLAIIMFMLAFAVQSLFSSLNILPATVSFLLFTYGDFYTLCEHFFHSHISKNRKRQQFYTAKNMVLNSYCKLGGIPNLWEVDKKDKYRYNCDMYEKIVKTFYITLFSTHICCFCQSSNPFQLIGMTLMGVTISIIITNIFHRLGIFLHLEWLFLANPTELELQVAIDGLDHWVQLENK